MKYIMETFPQKETSPSLEDNFIFQVSHNQRRRMKKEQLLQLAKVAAMDSEYIHYNNRDFNCG